MSRVTRGKDTSGDKTIFSVIVCWGSGGSGEEGCEPSYICSST